MAKGDKFYFDCFSACAAISKNAAEYLAECLENFDKDALEGMLEKMHDLEHAADVKKHEVTDALAKAFVTPVDREDLDMLADVLDHVPDRIEEVLQKLYIYNVRSLDESAVDFAKKLVRCTDILCELMGELENFKRSKRIRELVIALNDAEEDCDRLYLASARALTTGDSDALTIISMMKVYDSLESCADACEHVGDCVASLVMKNT